ncbi:hypothetical protein [Clostridium uliginosum]|uniref:Uncharacterized protein n=1 Tax=Clostridium uliginosum TaxID=119641 RepID=A0A1I1P676_9CLOT|nr:hypothetical protein [Clostridium uliginosum]SFD05434.1 hypothetical protein SAMN05421842_11824 [Clostridium uliginosum]
MKFILEVFIKITSEFEYIYKEYKVERKVYDYIIQSIYSLVISVLLGLPLQIIMAMIFIRLDIGIESKNIYNFIIPIYIFIVLIFLISYNQKNSKIRLSESLLKVCYLLKLVKWEKNIKETILNLLIIPLVLSGIIIGLLVPNSMDSNKYIVTCIIVLIINLIITLILYGEFQYDEEERSIRQFILWGIIFLLNVVLNVYQYSIFLNDTNFDKSQMVSFFITIFGLIFTLATIGDKARYMYDKLSKAHKDEVVNYMNNLESRWICEVVNSFNKLIMYGKFNSRKGKNGIITFSKHSAIWSMILIGCLLLESIIEYIFKKYFNIFIENFQKSTNQFKIMCFLILLLISLIFIVYRFIIDYRNMKIDQKIIGFSRVFLILSAILFFTSDLFKGNIQSAIRYVSILFFLAFVISMTIQEFYVKLENKRVNLKSSDKKSNKKEKQISDKSLSGTNIKDNKYKDREILTIINDTPIYYSKK